MGLVPLPPPPAASEIDVEAGPSVRSLISSQDTTATTPPTSPLPEPIRSRKRRRNSLNDELSSDSEFLPSQNTASTSASRSTVSLRGGGKRPPKSRRQGQAPNSQASSTHGHTQASRRTTRSKAKRASSPSDLVTTSLEEIALEDTAVKSEITRLGLTLRDVKGDGNCLFRVLSDQGFGGEKRHAEIRKLVCDYLESHKDVMEGFVVPFMKDGEGYEGYVARMRQLKQFGSHIEIQAAARVFKRNIRVVMSTTSFTIPWQTEATYARDPPATPTPADVGPVPTTPSHRTRSRGVHPTQIPSASLPDYLPSVKDSSSMLWLALFSQAEHFQSVRRMGDREHGPAEIEDRLSVPHVRDVSEAARRERGELVEEKKTKTPVSNSAKTTQLLASLPPGHEITPEHAENTLSRTRGDLGEAVDILLEEIEQEKEGQSISTLQSDSGSSDHVEHMLLSPVVDAPAPPPNIEPHRRMSDYRSVTRSRSNTPSTSPATTSTESRSHSTSRSRSRSDSNTSIQSGHTSQTELLEKNDLAENSEDGQSTEDLRQDLKEMQVHFGHGPDSGHYSLVKGDGLLKQTDILHRKKERSSLSRGRNERRRSSRLGVVGA
ncbi:uncharacterized protein IL334_001235 [Kwoniella shivajii]|uniref:OTU domain-containing protein n=1 Tax=Kwoniella shivajii TaxID=564305 RepID=A0ABZ1CRZ1_9TREE|nr:hypothetical protein IL334_001235 [Kwoniella shivajii]